MIPENWLFILLRFALAAIMGGAIGIERAGTNHDAGLRTHILVCLGAAGIMIMSEQLAAQYSTDISRIGAQVVSGIGFLGAGCILVNNNRVRGLTTAAGLWTTACVGLSVGVGYYFISVALTAFVLIVMLALRPISAHMQQKELRRGCVLQIHLRSRQDMKTVNDYLAEQGVQITALSLENDQLLSLSLAGITETGLNQLICALMECGGANKVERL